MSFVCEYETFARLSEKPHDYTRIGVGVGIAIGVVVVGIVAVINS